MQIKDEYIRQDCYYLYSVLGNQNVIIDQMLPKHYEWYSRNGLSHIFEAEATIKPTFDKPEVIEEVPVVKKTRTKKK
jgi:hypothetical protein